MAIYGYMRKGLPVTIMEQWQILTEYKVENVYIDEEDLVVEKELDQLVNKLQPGDGVVVYSLFVLGKRMRMTNEFNLIEYFKNNQIELVSVKEQIDTRQSPDFYRMYQISAVVDKQLKTVMMKQTIKKQKLAGVDIGRPRLSDEVVTKVCQLYDQRKSLRIIAEACGISLGSVHKYVTEYKLSKE